MHHWSFGVQRCMFSGYYIIVVRWSGKFPLWLSYIYNTLPQSLQLVCNQGNPSVVKTTTSFLQWTSTTCIHCLAVILQASLVMCCLCNGHKRFLLLLVPGLPQCSFYKCFLFNITACTTTGWCSLRDWSTFAITSFKEGSGLISRVGLIFREIRLHY